MGSRSIILLFLALVAISATPANAAITFSIENSADYTVGTTTATVGVFASSAASENFSEFIFAFDVLPAGVGLPAGITIAAPSLTNENAAYLSVGGSSITDSGPGGGQDFNVVGTRGGNFVAPPAPVKLFDLTFDIGAGTAPGAYEIRGSIADLRLSDGTPINGASMLSGALNVTAVPEPSSLGLAGLCVTAFAGFRRRRR